jgi:hypothetical protein
MSEPREFILRKMMAPIVESDFYAFEAIPEIELDSAEVATEKYAGLVRTIEKSAYDQVVKERDELNQHLDVARAVLRRKNYELTIALEAMKQSIARSDDHGDSYCSRPIRDALKQIEGK